MSYFKEPPALVLETMEEVREFIKRPRKSTNYDGNDAFRIKSLWLISLIDEIVASGKYPYNADVALFADERMGNPVQSHAEYSKEGTTLSLLVYNAQCYRSSDQLHAFGYVPFSDDVLKTAYDQGKKLKLIAESTLGGKYPVVLNVRNKAGQLYAMKPRSRGRYVSPSGQPVRFVERSDPTSDPQSNGEAVLFGGGIKVVVA